jgi:hypothetical protein
MNADLVPAKVVASLSEGVALDYEPVHWEKPERFRRPGELELGTFHVDPADTAQNAEPELNPYEGTKCHFEVAGVDLLTPTEEEESEGLLLWLPKERRFATWDSDHWVMWILGEEPVWDEILAHPQRYIEAMFDPAPTSPATTFGVFKPWEHGYQPIPGWPI